MGEKEYGFLTPKQRKYLRGELDLQDHSNPSQFKQRIRNRIFKSQEDYSLLENSDQWPNEETARAMRDSNAGGLWAYEYISDDRLDPVENSTVAQARAIGGPEMPHLYDDLIEVPNQLKEQNTEVKEVIVDLFVKVFTQLNSEGKDEMIKFVQKHWPSKEFVIDHIQAKE